MTTNDTPFSGVEITLGVPPDVLQALRAAGFLSPDTETKQAVGEAVALLIATALRWGIVLPPAKPAHELVVRAPTSKGMPSAEEISQRQQEFARRMAEINRDDDEQ